MLKKLLRALANNIFFMKILLDGRVLLFGLSKKDSQKLLGSYAKSPYFLSLILNPSSLLKENKKIQENDLIFVRDFKNSQAGGRHIDNQSDIEKYYTMLPEEKQLKFKEMFSKSILVSMINELREIDDIDIFKIIFYGQIVENMSANSRECFNNLRQFKTRIIDSFLKQGKDKYRIILSSEKRWNELDRIWSKEARNFGLPGIFEPTVIFNFILLCSVAAFLIKEAKIYQNPVALCGCLLSLLALVLLFLPSDLWSIRVEPPCGSTGKKIIEELERKGILLNERLMPLFEIAKDEIKQKKPVIIYKLAKIPPQSRTPQIPVSQSAPSNFSPLFFLKNSISKLPNLKQFMDEEKRAPSRQEKIYQTLVQQGYPLDDINNIFSPKLIEYNNRLVVFSFEEKALEKTIAGLDGKTVQILKKSIHNPNPQRFASIDSENLPDGQPILIKGRLDGKHLRIVATHKKIINLGSELGGIEEYNFTHIINKHGRTKFFKGNSSKHDPKTQSSILKSFEN
jgi:hypothetical protein